METADILNIAQTGSIVIVIALTLVQMKKHDETVRLSIDITLSSRLDELNGVLLERPELFSGLSEPYNGDSRPSIDARSILAYRFLNFYDDVYWYHGKGVLSKEALEGHILGMKKFVRMPYFSGFWKEVRTEYGQDFQTIIDKLLEEFRVH